MNVVLIGFKSAGKSTIGRILATRMRMRFVDLDDVVEDVYQRETGQKKRCRYIFRYDGEETFRQYESMALKEVAEQDGVLLAIGGGAPMPEANRPLLQKIGVIIYLDVDPEVIYERFQRNRMPVYLHEDDSYDAFKKVYDTRSSVYRSLASYSIEIHREEAENVVHEALRLLSLHEKP